MKDDQARRHTPEQTVLQGKLVEAAMRHAVRQTLIEHKQSGDPIVVCEGDEVSWISADEIVILELEPE
jgi:hypothetical protein